MQVAGQGRAESRAELSFLVPLPHQMITLSLVRRAAVDFGWVQFCLITAQFHSKKVTRQRRRRLVRDTVRWRSGLIELVSIRMTILMVTGCAQYAFAPAAERPRRCGRSTPRFSVLNAQCSTAPSAS